MKENNTGEIIKGYALAFLIIAVIIFIVWYIVDWFTLIESDDLVFLLRTSILVLELVFSMHMYFLLKGYGEIVEDTNKIKMILLTKVGVKENE